MAVHKIRSHLQSLGARRVTLIEVHTEEPEIFDATVQYLFVPVCKSRTFNLEGFVVSFTKPKAERKART